ncbi:hypothetical protein BC826DRAFT_228415 [Russula brevipes]|nr:hypothetical protein BC826DRAFT_228415 [Russula brevipes]
MCDGKTNREPYHLGHSHWSPAYRKSPCARPYFVRTDHVFSSLLVPSLLSSLALLCLMNAEIIKLAQTAQNCSAIPSFFHCCFPAMRKSLRHLEGSVRISEEHLVFLPAVHVAEPVVRTYSMITPKIVTNLIVLPSLRLLEAFSTRFLRKKLSARWLTRHAVVEMHKSTDESIFFVVGLSEIRRLLKDVPDSIIGLSFSA